MGDPQVPVAAGITLARAAGIVDEDDMKRLIEHGVVEGNWRLARYRTDGSGPHPYDPDFKYNGADGDTSILYDIDDLDNGADGMNAPSPETPLRATVSTPNGGKAGLRILYIKEHGSHGLLPPDPGAAFSIGTYGINMVTRYLVTGGKDLVDDPCLEDGSCAFFNN